VLIEIDVASARADGVTFYESDNGVILTSQQIHKKYIRKMKN
jgi:RNA:NAD 2'-phosphotransferase (TPT1/KptA family)